QAVAELSEFGDDRPGGERVRELLTGREQDHLGVPVDRRYRRLVAILAGEATGVESERLDLLFNRAADRRGAAGDQHRRLVPGSGVLLKEGAAGGGKGVAGGEQDRLERQVRGAERVGVGLTRSHHRGGEDRTAAA